MQPYEIRQFGDGTIDCDQYYTRPVSLTTPEMRRFCRSAASPKSLLLAAVMVAVLIFTVSLSTHRTTSAQNAPAQVCKLISA